MHGQFHRSQWRVDDAVSGQSTNGLKRDPEGRCRVTFVGAMDDFRLMAPYMEGRVEQLGLNQHVGRTSARSYGTLALYFDWLGNCGAISGTRLTDVADSLEPDLADLLHSSAGAAPVAAAGV